MLCLGRKSSIAIVRLRKPVLALSAAALAGSLAACGDPVTGGHVWLLNPFKSEHVVVNSNGPDVLHMVLNGVLLNNPIPSPTAQLVIPGSNFREDCAFNVPRVQPPTPLPGICTVILATGSVHPGSGKVYVARGTATGLFATFPSLSGGGTLAVEFVEQTKQTGFVQGLLVKVIARP